MVPHTPSDPLFKSPAGRPTHETVIRVLLVEDNPGDARLIQELFKEGVDRFDLTVATTVKDAMLALEEVHFHVTLLDLTLPDSRGIDTFHRLYSHSPQVPLIVLSGLDDESLAIETVKAGAQDYLVKGHVDRHTLVRAVHYGIERAAADRKLAEERNLLRSLIENLPDQVYVSDSSGTTLLCNEAYLANSIDMTPEVLQQMREDEAQVLHTGLPIANREMRVTSPDAPVQRWLSVTKVPLRNAEGEITGIVGIERDISERKRAEEQLYRYNAEIRQRNTELEEDLHMAREIQLAFMPQQFPTFPKGVSQAESALQFYSRYIPTTTVGGDFFHVLPLSSIEAGVFICDVMGHGVRAALVTAILRALVEEMITVAVEPGRFLSEINRAFLSILRRARTPMFASAFYLVVNVETQEIRFANAGHPRPLHLQRSIGNVSFLPTGRPGPALGLLEEAVYTTRRGRVEVGDLFLLFTDGLYEVEGPDSTLFDQEMLLRTVKEFQGETTEEIIHHTLARVQDFAVDHMFADDVCLVGVEVTRILQGGKR